MLAVIALYQLYWVTDDFISKFLNYGHHNYNNNSIVVIIVSYCVMYSYVKKRAKIPTYIPHPLLQGSSGCSDLLEVHDICLVNKDGSSRFHTVSCRQSACYLFFALFLSEMNFVFLSYFLYNFSSFLANFLSNRLHAQK